MLSLAASAAFSPQLSQPLAVGQRAAPLMRAPLGEQELLSRFGLPKEECTPTRREMLGLATGIALSSAMPSMAQAEDGMFSLPPLPYDYVRARLQLTNASCLL